VNPGWSDLAAVAETAGEFEAQAKAAILRAGVIEAMVVSNGGSWSSYLRLSSPGIGATVLVRREDRDRARALLRETIADSVDLDWDQVDVGEREDNLPLHPVNRMPLLARIGFALAVALVATCVLAIVGLFR
jgi:hypothetical protein